MAKQENAVRTLVNMYQVFRAGMSSARRLVGNLHPGSATAPSPPSLSSRRRERFELDGIKLPTPELKPVLSR